MKKIFLLVIFIAGIILSGNILFAQGPPLPPATGHGGTTNQSGGGAPIGSGIGILLALGAAYGGTKLYKAWKDKEEIEE